MKRLKQISSCLVCLLLTGAIWSCGSGNKKMETAIQKPAQNPEAAIVKPDLEQVEQVITEAKQHYFLGERELNLGHLEKAKDEFDASLDVLMRYQSEHDPSPKVEAVIDELQDKIFEHEMAALRAGDGFTEHPLEPAMIDDLKNISTFPIPDEQAKQEVEQELKNAVYDIPVEVNDTVLAFLRIWQNSRRKEFVGGLIRSGRYVDLMKKIFREEGLPEDLVYMALIESSFKPNAYSHARAKGFWQFISGTAKRYNLRMDWWVDERSDFEKSTRAAARYLKDLYGMFGDWYFAMAGYNAGENTILNGIRRTGAENFWELAQTRYIRLETKNYVPAILAGMIIAKDPQKYGFHEELERPLEYDKVAIDYTVDLRLVAECSGSSMEEIKLLNPELNRLITPSKVNSYELRIPKDTSETFLAEISTVPEDKRITWRKHEVKEGETLTSIATLYRASVGSISAVNSFQPDVTLSIGQKLVIPIGRSTPAVSHASRTSYANTPGDKRYHSVRSGDTLYKIATNYRVTIDQLCAWNGISSRHTLYPGQSLIVRYSRPATVETSGSASGKKIIYHVKQGDTLFQIANNHNTDVDSIMRWNKLHSRNAIYPGDRLTIYAK